MDGAYSIGTDHIRALALQCHALDLQFDRLFNTDTICGNSDKIYQTYNRLLSINLLNLAISIRVELKSEAKYTQKDGEIAACALFENGKPKDQGRFSIKDLCDKLIHAESIRKPREKSVEGASCDLSGSYQGHQWHLGLGVQIFCEFVLQWLDEIDNRALQGLANPPTAKAD